MILNRYFWPLLSFHLFFPGYIKEIPHKGFEEFTNSLLPVRTIIISVDCHVLGLQQFLIKKGTPLWLWFICPEDLLSVPANVFDTAATQCWSSAINLLYVLKNNTGWYSSKPTLILLHFYWGRIMMSYVFGTFY